MWLELFAVRDAKCDYPSACNAMETLLIDEELLSTSSFFTDVCNMFRAEGVTCQINTYFTLQNDNSNKTERRGKGKEEEKEKVEKVEKVENTRQSPADFDTAPRNYYIIFVDNVNGL